MKTLGFLIMYILWAGCASAQYFEPIDHVKLNFGRSLMPYNHLTIELLIYYGNKEKTAKAIVQGSIMSGNKKIKYTKIDTTFFIDMERFRKIVGVLMSISPSDIYSENTMGHDGSTYSIEFGNYQNNVRYSVWSPDYNTAERKLEGFLNASKMIVEVAKLDPDKL